MKNKTILNSFWAFLVAGILARFFQVAYTLEGSTGFFKNGFEKVGYSLSGIIAICLVCVAFFAFKAYIKPESAPKQNLLLEVSSLALAVALAVEVLKEKPLLNVLYWQQIGIKILGLATVCFFASFAFLSTNVMKKIKLFSIIPLIYFIVRLICCFVTVSSLSLISDNVLQIASYCVVVLFLLNFAKLYNGIESDVIFRKVLATGLVSSILLFATAIPNIILSFAKKGFSSHIQVVSSFSFLFLAVFILVFVFSYFSPKNSQ